MRFAQDASDGNSILACRPGEIIINEKKINTSLVVTPDNVKEWSPRCFDDITSQHIEQLIELQPEIIILGTGARQQFLPARFTAELQSRGIGVEVMNTEAACRTFNVLLSEGRQVIAAMIVE